MSQRTEQKTKSKPSTTDQERSFHLGWFALMALVGIVAFLVWFIVNGVDEA
ncbi:MAG TPA: hypothetical protein VI141_03600 [Acidimicrobiia bacterium]